MLRRNSSTHAFLSASSPALQPSRYRGYWQALQPPRNQRLRWGAAVCAAAWPAAGRQAPARSSAAESGSIRFVEVSALHKVCKTYIGKSFGSPGDSGLNPKVQRPHESGSLVPSLDITSSGTGRQERQASSTHHLEQLYPSTLWGVCRTLGSKRLINALGWFDLPLEAARCSDWCLCATEQDTSIIALLGDALF